VLQCVEIVAVRCSVLQCVVMCCVAVTSKRGSKYQLRSDKLIAVHCSVLPRAALCCNELWFVAVTTKRGSRREFCGRENLQIV